MITIDFETKSYADLTKVGAWAYSEDPTTDVICACWGIDDGPIQEWWPGKYTDNCIPKDLFLALDDDHTAEAHNVAFERSIWANVLEPRYGWPLPYDDRWRDLMAVACYLALPASLDGLSRALGYGPKNKFHQQFITRYCKLHLKTAKTEIPEDDFKKIVAECVDDVQREQAISNELGDLPERELEVFLMDQEINMRGLYLDQEGIAAATAIVDERSGELTEEFRALTGINPTQRDEVMRWCMKHGVELENLQAEYLEGLLDENLPQGTVRRAIEIRTSINKASTKKLDAMARQRGKDGRARFQSRYHGAITGRPTGSGFQPLNLHKGFDDVAPEQLVRDILYCDGRWLDMVYGSAMDAVAKASRHWIKAEEGYRIMVGDYVAIEAVILACLAGEQWKIDAFARGDLIYERMGEIIHGLPAGTVTKATHPQERFDGKTIELAGGFQGWLGAWLRIDKSGLYTDEEIKSFMGAWRDKHPMTVKFWRELENAAIQTVQTPDLGVFTCGYISFEVQDEWLTMILPNGKRLWYRDPELRMTMPPWHKPETEAACAAGTCRCEPRPQVTYMAWKNKQWKRVNTYGGKLAENATQATCREILVEAMKRVRAAGYPIILSVYDEVIAEVPNGFGSLEEFGALMIPRKDELGGDWPINVKVDEGVRYRKW